MPSFLVESYLAQSPGLLEEARSRARRTAELGQGVRYVRTTFVPGDETCFHLFEAPSSHVLGDAARLAALGYTRIVEAVDQREVED
ncbi:MAG: DUF4242 domain-containing protein [Gaiellaceae bacterium]